MIIIQKKEEITEEPKSPMEARLNGSKGNWPLIGVISTIRKMDTFFIVKGGRTMVSCVFRRVDLVVRR